MVSAVSGVKWDELAIRREAHAIAREVDEGFVGDTPGSKDVCSSTRVKVCVLDGDDGAVLELHTGCSLADCLSRRSSIDCREGHSGGVVDEVEELHVIEDGVFGLSVHLEHVSPGLLLRRVDHEVDRANRFGCGLSAFELRLVRRVEFLHPPDSGRWVWDFVEDGLDLLLGQLPVGHCLAKAAVLLAYDVVHSAVLA